MCVHVLLLFLHVKRSGLVSQMLKAACLVGKGGPETRDMHVSIFHILSGHSRGTYGAPTLLESDYTAKYEWDVSNKFN